MDPSGRERARSFRRKLDAERFIATVEADKVRGEWTDPELGRRKFEDVLPTWRASRVDLRPSTRATDESLLRNHVLPHFAGRRIGSVRPTDVQAFVVELESKGISPATIRLAYLLVRRVFKTAVEAELISRSPCRSIKLPRRLPIEMRFLDANEVAALAAAVRSEHRALVITAAYTGCRFGELAGLRLPRLDLIRRRLTVVEALVEVRGHVTLDEPKTAAARRRIALPEFLCDELTRHLERYPPGADGSVFGSPDGGPLRRTNFRNRDWKAAVQATVGEPMRFHDLRHTHAAMLIAQGEHPKVIQSRLGHSSIQVTLDTYGHLFDGIDDAAAERLHEAFGRTLTDSRRTLSPDQGLELGL